MATAALSDKPDQVTAGEPVTPTKAEAGTGPLTPEEFRQAMAAVPTQPVPQSPEEYLQAAVLKGIKGDPKHRPSHPLPGDRISSNGAVEGRYVPTPSLDGRHITLLENYKDHAGYVQTALDAFNLVYEGLGHLSKARELTKKDTSLTEAGQVLALAGEAEKLMSRSAKAIDAATNNLTKGIEAYESQLNGPMTAKADSLIGREVREHAKGLSDAKRREFLEEAVKRKDFDTLQSVLGTFHYLSNITTEQKAYYTRRYNELKSPEINARIEIMKKARELLYQRSGLVFTEIERALGAGFDVVKKLRTTNDEAARARLLINPSPIL